MIDKIRSHYWNNCWIDFSIFLHERGRLIIAGSSDLCYYHNFELIIEDTSYISGMTEWTCDPSDEFLKISEKNEQDSPDTVLEFYSEATLQMKIVAMKISINFDAVFYYKRENLKPGERLAYWLK